MTHTTICLLWILPAVVAPISLVADSFPAPPPNSVSKLDKSELDSYPARAVVKITSYDRQSNSEVTCLGAITGPDEITTVAHCLCGEDGKFVPKDAVTIEISASFKSIFAETIKVTKRWALQAWLDESPKRDPEHENCPHETDRLHRRRSKEHVTLVVDQRIGERLGYFGIYGVSKGNPGTLPTVSASTLAQCTGPVADPFNAILVERAGNRSFDYDARLLEKLRVCSFLQRGDRRELARCGLGGMADNYLNHNCATSLGDSGTPLFFVRNSEAILIAVHSYANRIEEKFGYGNSGGAVFYLGAPPKPNAAVDGTIK